MLLVNCLSRNIIKHRFSKCVGVKRSIERETEGNSRKPDSLACKIRASPCKIPQDLLSTVITAINCFLIRTAGIVSSMRQPIGRLSFEWLRKIVPYRFPRTEFPVSSSQQSREETQWQVYPCRRNGNTLCKQCVRHRTVKSSVSKKQRSCHSSRYAGIRFREDPCM